MKHPTKPIDPAVFDAKMRDCDTQIQQLERERADYLHKLASDPDNPKLHQLAAQLKDEIAEHNATKDRLVESRAVAARRFNAAAHQEYVNSLEADHQELAKVNEDIVAAGAAFINELAPALAAHLQRLDDLGKRRAALVYGVTRAGRETGDRRMKHLSEMARMRGAKGIGHAAVIALRAALYRAGLGRLAPELGVEVPPPPELMGRTGWVYSTTESRGVRVGPDQRSLWRNPDADLVELMKLERERELSYEDYIVREAINVVKQAAPGAART